MKHILTTLAETKTFENSELVNDLYNMLCLHKHLLQASELTDDETAYLTQIEKTLSEMKGLELFWSPLLENEEGDIVEPYTKEA